MTIHTALRHKITFSASISILALCISVVSLYFTYFRESHSLKAGIVRFEPDDNSLPVNLTADLILLNQGNQTETVLEAELALHGDNGFVYGGSKGPYVLKAGEAMPVQLAWSKLDDSIFDDFSLWNKDSLQKQGRFELTAHTSTVGTTGIEVENFIPICSITLDEASGELKFVYPPNKRLNLVDILQIQK